MRIINIITVSTLCLCLTFSSCDVISNTSSGVKGGVVGTGAGAAVGAGVGAIAGNTGLGAIIGAVVGGTAGALIGNKMDKQRKELEAIEGAKVESINDGEATKVTFESGILFKTGSSTLNDVSKSSLYKFAASLKNNPETNVEILGHTDNTGTDKVNIPLSQQRAASVQSYLMSQGITAGRILSFGKGSAQPIDTNETTAGRTQNRRVEVIILANETMIKDAQKGTLK